VHGRRLILAGGGGADDSRPLDEVFAAWTGPAGRMLYLPVAGDGRRPPYDACLAWATSVFAPLGVAAVEMWTDLSDRDPARVAAFASVYLGGGNAFRLLDRLRASGFDRALAAFADRGGAVYGGSAGAIVLGRDARTAAHADANEAGLRDTRGLDLAAGHAVWCHYRPEDDPLVAAYAARHRVPVLALSERSGVRSAGGGFAAWGHEAVVRFAGGRKQAIAPGRRIPA
jgi:dipeptidase E